MNIYVGNLSYGMTTEDLQELFEGYGSVKNTNIINDRETGRSKGFGFIEMTEASEGEKAIQELDGKDFMGRNLKVNQAREREERPKRSW